MVHNAISKFIFDSSYCHSSHFSYFRSEASVAASACVAKEMRRIIDVDSSGSQMKRHKHIIT
jgi:hypothetical protein